MLGRPVMVMKSTHARNQDGGFTTMQIRAAKTADGPHVLHLVSTILSSEFPADQAAYAIEDLQKLHETYKGPNSTFLVAEEDGRIVGTCGIKAESPQTAILRRLFVDPGYRGKGVGKDLLDAALLFCRAQHFREIVIRTSTRMDKAIALCRSKGFEEEGRWTLGDVTLIRFRMRLS